jgi:hypothetical protein
MKRAFTSMVMVLSFSFLMAQNSPDQTQTSWQEVEVVYEADKVTGMEKGETLSSTINTSLNFGTRAKFRKNCLNDLKKEAAQKGYSTVLIDEKASNEKRFNKRGFEITLVAKGYKG